MGQYQEIINITLYSVIFTGILSIPIIYLLYHFKVIRKIDVDFSTLIEDRKSKYGTPIMGGLIFIVPIVLLNYVFNLNQYTFIPVNLFFAIGLLGAMDDLMNTFGKERKIRTLSRSLKLLKVHKSIWKRITHFILLPWTAFGSLMHMFESNPGNGLRAHEKIVVQGLIGIILGYWVKVVIGDNLWIPFLGNFGLGNWIIPFTAFVFVSMVNAVNITDGMDGLAGGISSIVLVSLVPLLVANSTGMQQITFVAISVAALLIYLYFNIPPARVQMGDTGSFALGGLITIIFFMIGKPILLLFFGAPFVVEILSTIAQSFSRRIFGRRLLQMAPLHHHFEMLGWREDKVVFRFWIITVMCCLFGLWLSFL
jgi:phospho-N-acetylmuramoyl-pentapeptide-transferase